MDFGKKTTYKDKAREMENRYGKTTGASKGSAPPPKVKIKPKGNPLKGKFGIQITKKF